MDELGHKPASYTMAVYKQLAAERTAVDAERNRLICSLVRGEAQIGGARVRLEWVDPKPDWIDEWVASVG